MSKPSDMDDLLRTFSILKGATYEAPDQQIVERHPGHVGKAVRNTSCRHRSKLISSTTKGEK